MHCQVMGPLLCIVARLFGELLIGDVSDEKTDGPVSQTYDRGEPALEPSRTHRNLEAVFHKLGAPRFDHAADGSGQTPADFVSDCFADVVAEQLARGRY